MEYCNENIKDVYHELFDEALARYNEKQNDLKGQKWKVEKALER